VRPVRAVIVTGHTPNFLPGASVIRKAMSADAVIWMDLMQYERHGFCNRNRFSDGAWLTVPVNVEDDRKPFNEVRIADPSGFARRKIARTLEHKIGHEATSFARELTRPYEMLVGLNVALLRLMLSVADTYTYPPDEHMQSHIAAGRYDDVSHGLAAMTAELGGTVWLSGPSGRNYLDERPFAERGIRVDYFEHVGPNPCALELLRAPLAA
jgi:hypothetical protein